MDLMALEDEPAPNAGQELAVHVLGRRGEATEVRPAAVEPLHRTYFRDGQVGGGSALSVGSGGWRWAWPRSTWGRGDPPPRQRGQGTAPPGTGQLPGKFGSPAEG